MFCTECGEKQQPEAKYCFACGHAHYGVSAENQAVSEDMLAHEQNDAALSSVSASISDSQKIDVTSPISISSSNVVLRHWRGDYSLGLSYWVFGVLLNGFVAVGATVLFESSIWSSLAPVEVGLGIVLFYLLLLLLIVWQSTGIFRSADQHVSRGGKSFWATAAKVMVIIGLLRSLAEFGSVGMPMLKESFNLISGEDNLPAYELRILRDGKELELSGGMPYGTAEAVRSLLSQTPTIEIIHLNNIGGRIQEGLELAEEIRKRNLSTYTATECSSACTIAFIAGSERYLSENGRIGFHSVSFGTLDGSDVEEINDEMRQVLRRNQVPESFIDEALATPADKMWYPDQAELIKANIIDEVVDPDFFGFSGISEWRSLHKTEEALLSAPLYKTVSEYDPVLYEQLLEVVHTGFKLGKSLNQIKENVRNKLLPVIQSRYLAIGPNTELVGYWKTQINEIEYLNQKDPNACVAFVFPELASSPIDLPKMLPQDMQEADLAALTLLIKGGSINPQTGESTAQVQNDIEMVVTQIAIRGQKYLDVISDPAQFTHDPRLQCESLLMLYQMILDLPSDRAGPILRFMLAGNQ